MITIPQDAPTEDAVTPGHEMYSCRECAGLTFTIEAKATDLCRRPDNRLSCAGCGAFHGSIGWVNFA